MARYLAYCVDGGLLCAKFTLLTVVKIVDRIEDPEKVHTEIAHLLHAHSKRDFEIKENLKDTAKDIDSVNDSFNQLVMAALIKFGYLQGLMKAQSAYPKFLTAMLRDDPGEDQTAN